jgi:hypothetical protein
MADYSKQPSDPREPLLFRLNAQAWGPDPASPAGGGGAGQFTCRLPTGSSALVNAYDRKPGPLTPQQAVASDGWWEDWWGEVERAWDKTSADVADAYERARQVRRAFDLAFERGRVWRAIEEEAGVIAKGLPDALYAGLKEMAWVLVKSTLAGAAVGGILTIEVGGGGAIPFGVLGFKLGVLYLAVTGLAEVADHLAENIGEVMARLRVGVERAWNAGRYGRPKSEDITAAADIMAGSVGVLFRLTLEAVVAVILLKGIRLTVASLAEGQFGKEFAYWVQQNERQLTSNPKLRPKTKAKGGAAEEAAGGGGRRPAKSGTKAAAAEPGRPSTMRVMSADEANAPHVAAGNRPPYAKGTVARDVVTNEEAKFVRVHGETNQARSWMMREEEIRGLSPGQIQEKFALPEPPSYVSDVNVPAGTKIRVGTVGAQEGWGSGGGVQYELQQRLPPSAFTNRRPLK